MKPVSLMKQMLLSLGLLCGMFSAVAQAPSWERRNTTGPIQTPPAQVARQTVTLNATTAWHLMRNAGSDATHSYLARTSNGTDWTHLPITGSPGYQALNLTAVDASTAYVAQAHSPDGYTSQGEILRTQDGGLTWKKITNTEYTSAGSVLRWVHFFDASTGVAFGDPMDSSFEVYRTTNAGTTWQRVDASNLPLPFFGEGASGYFIGTPYFALGNTIWTGTSAGRIFKSTDQGRTWTAVLPFPESGSTWSMAFQDANHGLAYDPSAADYTYDAFIIRTADGGATWEKITPLYNRKGCVYITQLDAIPGAYISVGVTGELPDPDFAGQGSSVSADGISWVDIDRDLPRNRYISLDALSATVAFATSATDAHSQDNPGAGGFYQLQGNLLAGLVTASRTTNEARTATVYPNPSASGRFQLLLSPGFAPAEVTISDLVGRWVTTQRVSLPTGGSPTATVDLSPYPAGLYHLHVQTGKGTQTLRIISK